VQAVTPRALVSGLLLAFVTGAAGPHIGLYLQGSNSGAYYTSPVAHVLLFVMIVVVNVLLGMLRLSWRYDSGELVVIFIFMSLANAASGYLSHWLPLVASPYYHATAENNWANTITPYVPDWLVPRDGAGIRAFFEGHRGESHGIPWDAWTGPLLSWLPLMVALCVAMLCLMVIVRRQWVDKERWIYPVMQLNLSMVQQDHRLLGPFFHNNVMWIGFAVPVVVCAMVGLHNYFPFFPNVEVTFPFPFFKARISFATLGFFFLIQREVAFALWVFYLLNEAQVAIYEKIGWGLEKEAIVSVWSYGPASLVHQGMGAMIVLVLGGLWVGREHLFQVLRKAFTGAPGVDDSDEIISYRGAVIGLLCSVGVLIYWLLEAGIPLLGVLVLLAFSFAIYVALTRAVAEGGVAVIYSPMTASDATLSAIGTGAFGPHGLLGMAWPRVFANDCLNFFMPHIANGLRLSGQIERGRRWLFPGMLAAMLVGLSGSLYMLMHLAYTYGAVNLRPPNFVWLPNYVFDYVAARIAEPTGPDLAGWFHTGVGSIVMILLLLARRFWTWWPLHPVGFPISSTLHWIAFSAFLAWLIKGPVLRYGGVRLYRQIRPFFLGLILGQFAIYGVFWVIDSFTGMVGNYLPY
jgi:hypothetical protein